MTVTYIAYRIDGLAHTHHEVSANQLIESLQGFVSSVEEANKVINDGIASDLKINIVAFNEGSFKAIFQVIQDKGQSALDFLGYTKIAEHGDKLITRVTDALDRINTRSFEISQNEDGTRTIILDTGESFVTTKDVAISVKNPRIRNGIEKVLSTPLTDEGTEIVELSLYDPEKRQVIEHSTNSISIENYESFQFSPISMEDDVKIETHTYIINFLRVNFTGMAGWQVKLPNGKKPKVKVEDEKFMRKIRDEKERDKQSFKYDDLFEVNLKVTTKHNRHSKKTTTSYIITDVLKKINDKG
jgi:hypothetical protein